MGGQSLDSLAGRDEREEQGPQEEERGGTRTKWKRQPVEARRSGVGRRGSAGGKSCLLPTPILRGRTWSSQSDPVYSRIRFMPPLSDYGP